MGASGKNSASDIAEQNRRDEMARQENIRQGTTKINTIFDGTKSGTGQLSAGAAYDANGKYYKADGSQWSGDANQFATDAAAGNLFSGVTTTGGQFNDDFYKKQQQNYLAYSQPQLDKQYADAQKQLSYSLARSGNLDSSARSAKEAELKSLYDTNNASLASKALDYANTSRNSVEDARANLITQLNATGDATAAANNALSRASALSQPTAYSPLSDLFSTFTSAIGKDAAAEQAYYATNGQYGSQGAGLFKPSSVKVS